MIPALIPQLTKTALAGDRRALLVWYRSKRDLALDLRFGLLLRDPGHATRRPAAIVLPGVRAIPERGDLELRIAMAVA
jgi:hypothetical protein